jgi:UDP-2,3-diacylglucosamine hydrolase
MSAPASGAAPPAAAVPALAPALDRARLQAPVFISDLHLSSARPRTVARFLDFVTRLGAPARELVILGDLFEFWAGDDTLVPGPVAVDPDDRLGREVARALRELTARGLRVLVMHGNRDPLLGEGFLQASGAQLLADPCLAVLGAGTPQELAVLLSHGDAYCTLDTAYMAFRRQARDARFQAGFLARSLQERRAMLGQARLQSEAGKRQLAEQIMDVTPEAVDAALRAAGVPRMLHGHTHRPAHHELAVDGAAGWRWVLPDWDLDETPARGGGLRWEDGGLRTFEA